MPHIVPEALEIVQQVRASGYEAQRPDITTQHHGRPTSVF